MCMCVCVWGGGGGGCRVSDIILSLNKNIMLWPLIKLFCHGNLNQGHTLYSIQDEVIRLKKIKLYPLPYQIFKTILH